MKYWIISFVVVLSLACLTEGLATPAETPKVENETTPFSIPECRSAPGVTFEIKKTGEYLVELIANGLQPGETPYVYYNNVGDTGQDNGGSFPGNVVNENGEFFSDMNWKFWDVDILELPEGQPTTTWEFRVEHADGVECATITLP